MSHSAVRKYMSPYERMVEMYHPNSKPMDFSKGMYPRHEHGNVDFWGARVCRKPRIAYTILRIAKARAGQRELFPILSKRIRPSKKAKRLMYV